MEVAPANSAGLSAAERNHILQLTSLFERASWALNRFATLLREAPGTVTEASGENVSVSAYA